MAVWPDESFTCPVTDNDCATLTPSDSQKGNIEIRTQHACVTFQPGSVHRTTVVTIEERTVRSTRSSKSSPFGPIISLGPHGQQFSKKFNMTILFPDLAQYPDPSAIYLFYSNAEESEPALWKDVTTDSAYRVHIQDHKVTFSTDHFCKFCLQFGSAVLFHLHFERLLQIAVLFRTIAETGHTTGVLRLTASFHNVHEVYGGDNGGFQMAGLITVWCLRGDGIDLSVLSDCFRGKSVTRKSPGSWPGMIQVTSINNTFTFEDNVSPTNHATQHEDCVLSNGTVECCKSLPREVGQPALLGSCVLQVFIHQVQKTAHRFFHTTFVKKLPIR